jgi:hypothetical protein
MKTDAHFTGLGPNNIMIREKLLDDRGDRWFGPKCIDKLELVIYNRKDAPSYSMHVVIDKNQAINLKNWIEEYLK